MSKKRVHEIAKELKDNHAIELDNKAVVTELQSLGYDVKSHSSSLEDDQAIAAVQRIVEKRKPKTAAAPVAPKGFVVRRKVGDATIQTVAAPPSGIQISRPVAAPPVSAPVDQVAEFAPVAAAPASAGIVTAAAPPVESHIVAPAPAPAAADASASVPVAAAAPVAVNTAEAPVNAPAAPAPATTPTAVEQPHVSAFAGATVAAAPAVFRAPVSAPRVSSPVASGAAVVPPSAVPPMVRSGLAARSSAPRPGVTIRPQLGGPAGATATGLATAATPTRPTMPTATQAVLVSRPLIAIKRVTPTHQPNRYPLAPGKKAIGEVREFKVVPNQFGAGTKESIDLKAKEKERRGSGRTAKDKTTETTEATVIREQIFGRVSIPIRGKKKKPTKKGQKTQITEMAEEKKVIKVQDGITVSELSQRMGVKTTELIKKLMASGKMVNATMTIDAETAGIVALGYGWTVKKVGFEVEDFLPKAEENPENSIRRPPVVTVMGHVDHGKTSLLDAIRSANVAGAETGGITQHIGAYTVKSTHGDITFLDTPGHEAFSAMRSRGANITDVVVLVVAADDGVMPQTKEAIEHAKKAEVPIVVAINKMDVPGANIDRVKKDLADNGLLAEEWGGDVIMVPVSAKQKTGLELLLENISLQSEVLDLKANPNRPLQGTILEAFLEKGRGPIATVLVQEGTLRKGDAVVSGIYYGRVRMLVNDKGQQVDELKPGYSAEVIGLSGVPTAGDAIHAVADEKAAKQIADHRILKARQAEAGKTSRETLADLLAKQKVADQKELKVVLKADVSGSLEAVADAVIKLSTKKVKVTIVQKSVGMMTETDMNNASAFGASVIGFNSRPESGAEQAAKVLEVKWDTYAIIYELLTAITHMMEDLLDPIRVEKKLGKAEVRNLFNVPKLGTIAGSSVTEGMVKRSAHVRVWRSNKQVFQGKLASLKRFKDDVKEVAMGFECGIGIEGFAEIQAGDVIEAFEIEEIRPSLS